MHMQAQCTTAHYSQATNHDRLTLSLVDPCLDIWGEKKQAAEMYKKNSRQTTNLHDGVYVLDHGRASCTCLNSFYYEVIPGGSMPRDLGRKK